MDKETLVIDDVANNDSFNILLSLEGDPFEEYKETDKNVKELYFDNDDKKLYELNQITSPKENDKSDDPSTSQILENYKTPHSNKRNNKTNNKIQKEPETLDTAVTATTTRLTPLPLMTWADSSEVWQNMVYKEEATLKSRNSKLLLQKNTYLPRMRAILLDWIMEVCEVYHLGRTTYYLAVDYIDRFLTIRPMTPKTQLQLLGVTCLFIAAKLEEIYPPKLSEFSYVCDGACTEKEILSCEVRLLNTLDWDVNPMTPTGWLNLYMQIHYNVTNLTKQKLHEGVTSNFQFPQYSGYEFTRASHVMDLFSMDPGFLEFSYSIVAAGAIYYVFGKDIALNVSGLIWSQLESCVDYMYVFHKVIEDANDPRLLTVPANHNDERLRASLKALRKRNPFIVPDENHRLQTHVIDLEYFEKTAKLRSQISDDKNVEENQNDINKPKADDNISSPEIDPNTEVISEIEKILEEHYFANNDITCSEKSDQLV